MRPIPVVFDGVDGVITHHVFAAQRFKVSGFGQPRNPSEYTA